MGCSPSTPQYVRTDSVRRLIVREQQKLGKNEIIFKPRLDHPALNVQTHSCVSGVTARSGEEGTARSGEEDAEDSSSFYKTDANVLLYHATNHFDTVDERDAAMVGGRLHKERR